MKVALVCIAKNEDHYIQEWITYHKKIGFDDIFIYQNDWRCDVNEENVYKFVLDGHNTQPKCYNIFIKEYKNEYDWAAFLDVDEFLVLKKHTNVKEFINDYILYPSIGINWVLFGNNNLEESVSDYSMIERFTKRQEKVNSHIKSIVNLKNTVIMNIHCPVNIHNVDCNHNKFFGPFNPKGDDGIAQINHYFCKTRREWIEKIGRGRPDTTNYQNSIREKRTVSDFDHWNFNEIEDYTALTFYKNNK